MLTETTFKDIYVALCYVLSVALSSYLGLGCTAFLGVCSLMTALYNILSMRTASMTCPTTFLIIPNTYNLSCSFLHSA